MARIGIGAKTKRAKRDARQAALAGIAVFLLAAGAGAVVAFRVPRQLAPQADALAEAVQRGPDSYFHHFFDPDHVFGPVGQVDLTLDNFERETTHALLFAAIAPTPPDIPEFTMKAAEIWAPGVDYADNGLVVFVFPASRRIRVEVGYGLESELPDALVGRLVDEHLAPQLREGRFLEGVEAVVPPLLARMRAVPPAARRKLDALGELAVTARELPRKARLVWRAWLTNPPGARIVLSTVAAALLALFAVMLVQIGQCGVHLVRRLSSRGDVQRRTEATLDLVGSLLRLLQVAAILFVMAMGTSFFFPGTGSFGGAGVDILF